MARSWSNSRRCPICGKSGTSYNKSLRCRGFRGEGERVYCEEPNDRTPISPLGYKLYEYSAAG